ncbi:SDR family oxidoreductase [Bacillus timonensis]|nr:SDR family oxidoreductase [Bacillus timonensis]
MQHTILITGAGSGLGKELAIQYAKKGHTIILVGRDQQKLDAVKEFIVNQNGSAYSYSLDITSIKQVEQVTETILNKHEVSFLINNTGIGHFGSLQTLKIAQIDSIIDTNVKGTIYLTKVLLSHLLKRKHAKIINIISTAGLKGKVNESVYVASKYAVRGFTESLVKELETTNISVTAVYMGGMDTPFWNGSTHIKDKSRLRSPKEVASLILQEDDGRAEIFIK